MVSKVCDPEKKNFFTRPHPYKQLGSQKYACQNPSGSPVPCNHAKEILCWPQEQSVCKAALLQPGLSHGALG